ncbi:hypothetical protein ACJ41O_012187 [Fusarium nematophilum]
MSTLPASWYTSKAIYNLERHAIFLKSWILLGSVTRWPNANEDYLCELAQIDYIIRRSSSDWKTTKIFSEADGSEIRSHLTQTGLLFLTFSDETPSFEEFFPGLEELLSGTDFTKFPIRTPLHYQVDYNWKTMVDGYQECLHCAYAHPEFSKTYIPTTYKVVNKHNYSQHLAGPCQPNDGLFVYLFPNATLSLYGGGMTSWRVCPSVDPGKAVMDFDYYHVAPADSAEFKEYFRFTRNVALEDKELCEKAQENLNAGIYTAGILNPNKENGVLWKGFGDVF